MHGPGGPRAGPGLRLLLFALAVWATSAHVALAVEFTVVSAHTILVNGVYRLQARFELPLSKDALQALANGVPLTFAIDMEVDRKRDYLWNEAVAQLEQRYRLEYHSLTGHYLVQNLNTGTQESYPNLQEALKALSHLDNFPMLDRHLLDRGERYEASVRVRLDIESLPGPLRPLAYVSPGWYLSSAWYSWPLNP